MLDKYDKFAAKYLSRTPSAVMGTYVLLSLISALQETFHFQQTFQEKHILLLSEVTCKMKDGKTDDSPWMKAIRGIRLGMHMLVRFSKQYFFSRGTTLVRGQGRAGIVCVFSVADPFRIV